MNKDIKLSLDVSHTPNKFTIWENCGSHTIRLNAYFDVNLKINDRGMRIKLDTLRSILDANKDLREFFIEESKNSIKAIQKEVINYKDNRPIKDNEFLYSCADICISCYDSENGMYFCISVLTEDGRNKIVEEWEKFIKENI